MSDLRIQSPGQIRTLGGNAPVALTGITSLAHMAPHGDQRRRGDIHRIRTQGNGLDHIRGTAERTGSHQRHGGTNALVPQPLVRSCQRQLNGNTHIVAYAGGRCAGAAAKTVDYHNIRTGTSHAGGDGRNVMYRCNLNGNGLFVIRGLLQRPDQLAQVLNGINIMMWSR